MKPSGTIYRAKDSTSGEIRISLSQKEVKRIKILHWMGANFASFAIAAVLFFYGPSFLMDFDYITGYARIHTNSIEASDVTPTPKPTRYPALNPAAVSTSTPSLTPSPVPSVREFSISIPAISAESNVIEDVDPFNKDQYLKALKEGIAQAKGTMKPGQGGRIYLFAHSTNSPLYFAEFNAVFYQLRLLQKGDVIIAKYNGNTFVYRVAQKVVVDANDLSWLEGKPSSEDLVLQTCDPPGTTLHRLLVIAEPDRS